MNLPTHQHHSFFEDGLWSFGVGESEGVAGNCPFRRTQNGLSNNVLGWVQLNVHKSARCGPNLKIIAF